MPEAASPSSFGEREITLTRSFAAPRELVFSLWTDPARLARWWGPAGFTNPVCEIDARPGGALRIVMRAPDGTEHPVEGVVQEIVPPERLVFTNQAVDANGNRLLEGLTTVTFLEQDGGTHLILNSRARGLMAQAPAMLAGMEAGWSQSLDRLVALAAAR
jgi:uncharacterized protein YndB with AHSA1/START domain